jgi:hypothetical protein
VRAPRLLSRLPCAAFVALIASATVQATDPTKAETEEWVKTLAPLPEGGWEWLTWGLGTAVYVSYRNAQRDGAVATAWLRWEFLSPRQYNGVSYKSNVARTQFDCVQMASRAQRVTLYESNSLGGESQSLGYDKPPAWSPAIPGTLDEVVVTAVCNRTKLHSPKAKASS